MGESSPKKGRPELTNAVKRKRAEWNALFATLLREAPTRPTSQAISQAVSSRLGRDRKGKKREVSEVLVQKWRSPNSSRRLVPVDKEVAGAVVDSLYELGVIPNTAAGREAQEKLLGLLGFESTTTVDQMLSRAFATATKNLHEALKKFTGAVDGSGLPREPEVLLAAACLLSQELFDNAKARLQAENGQVIVLARWDSGRDDTAAKSRNALTESIRESGSRFFDLLRQNTGVHFVFRVFGPSEGVASELMHLSQTLLEDEQERQAQNASNGSVAAPQTPIVAKVTGAAEMAEDSHDRSAGRRASQRQQDAPALVVSCQTLKEITPNTVQDAWIHLLPGDKPFAWRLLRHADLFDRIPDTRATAFCSPLSELDLRRLLSELGTVWNANRSRWDIHPEAAITKIAWDAKKKKYTVAPNT